MRFFRFSNRSSRTNIEIDGGFLLDGGRLFGSFSILPLDHENSSYHNQQRRHYYANRCARRPIYLAAAAAAFWSLPLDVEYRSSVICLAAMVRHVSKTVELNPRRLRCFVSANSTIVTRGSSVVDTVVSHDRVNGMLGRHEKYRTVQRIARPHGISIVIILRGGGTGKGDNAANVSVRVARDFFVELSVRRGKRKDFGNFAAFGTEAIKGSRVGGSKEIAGDNTSGGILAAANLLIVVVVRHGRSSIQSRKDCVVVLVLAKTPKGPSDPRTSLQILPGRNKVVDDRRGVARVALALGRRRSKTVVGHAVLAIVIPTNGALVAHLRGCPQFGLLDNTPLGGSIVDVKDHDRTRFDSRAILVVVVGTAVGRTHLTSRLLL